MKLNQALLVLVGSFWCIFLSLLVTCAPSAYRKNVALTVTHASNQSSTNAKNETSVEEEFGKRKITGSGLMPVMEKRKLVNDEVRGNNRLNNRVLPSNHQVRWLEPESFRPVESKVKSQIEKPAIEYHKPLEQEEDGSEDQDDHSQGNNQHGQQYSEPRPGDKRNQHENGKSETNQQSEEQSDDNHQQDNGQSDYEQDNQNGELKYGERHKGRQEPEKKREYSKKQEEVKYQNSQQYRQPDNQYNGGQQHQEEQYHQPESNEKNHQDKGALQYQDSPHYEPPQNAELYDNRNQVIPQYQDNPEIPQYQDNPEIPQYQESPKVPQYQENQYQKEPAKESGTPEEQYNEPPANGLEQPELVGRIPQAVKHYNQGTGSQVSYFWKAVPGHGDNLESSNKFNYVMHVSKIDLDRLENEP